MIEVLYHPTDSYFVGIVEIENTHDLSVNELLKLAQVTSEEIIAVQFLNSHLIAGSIHLMSAAQNALNAWLGDYPISRSLDVEIILYASAQRQISVALDEFGLRDNLKTVALVIIGTKRDEIQKILEDISQEIGHILSVPFQPSEERMTLISTHFDIPEIEISTLTSASDIDSRWDALSKCVTSRVSLVAVDS